MLTGDKFAGLTCAEITGQNAVLTPASPVIHHSGLSPVVADPSVLTPDMTKDGLWHLFCHDNLSLRHYVSEDGIRFGSFNRLAKAGMRPDISRVGDAYYLCFEQTELLRSALSLAGGKWRSHIALTVSEDLIHWTEPVNVLDFGGPLADNGRGRSISNPFLVSTPGGWRLYFSCGLTYIDDCGFCEPTYISYADSVRLTGPFKPSGRIVCAPGTLPYTDICSGCLKVIRAKDGWLGLQNGIYRRGSKSASAIIALRSADGVNFEPLYDRPLIEPTGDPDSWTGSHVYACCPTLFEDEIRLYFNARNSVSLFKGKENIGFITMNMKEARQ